MPNSNSNSTNTRLMISILLKNMHHPHSHHFPLLFFFLLLLLFPSSSLSLNSDGILLLSFKLSILSDPLSLLHNWNFYDPTPCFWTGVTCSSSSSHVISLTLPNSHLLGVIPPTLGLLPFLQTLDLSNNFINGTLPLSLFNASKLQVLSLSNNVITGGIPDLSGLTSLRILNLSDNAFTDAVPKSITSLKNLTVVSLRSNYLSGPVPAGVQSIQILDLSSNLLNGSLPDEFGGGNLKYLNLSSNNISGLLPPQFAKSIPRDGTVVDLSFNDLFGHIPGPTVLSDQKAECFDGNSGLCGKPLKKLCLIPSDMANPPNVSSVNTSTPAIAAIPRTIDSNSPGTSSGAAHQVRVNGFKQGEIAGIAIAPLAGLGILAAVVMYVYHKKKANAVISDNAKKEKRNLPNWPCYGDETSEATSSEIDENNANHVPTHHPQVINSERSLVMVDGETEMEIETLLKASAYVLGTSGSTIVYKAVLQDGIAFAVRRIGERNVSQVKEFEKRVRAIAKLRHQNIVRIRGFYWGDDEKLVIYDYASNGSLANVGYRKTSSSPNHLSFDTRLKIAKGIARGINFIHEKKQVHGNIKPGNILLNADMEPLISDFGLHWLISGNNTSGEPSPYRAPESLDHSSKPDPKCDIYSFGILLLELLTGRVFSNRELSRWNGGEEASRFLRMSYVAGREEATLTWAELGFQCASLDPRERPSMKDAVSVLEKIPCSY